MNEFCRRFLPRETRRHPVLIGPLRGALIQTSWHDYPGAILGTTERHLLRWFERHVSPGETWLDVGAHYGYTAIALSRLVGPSGRVFAFEPVKSTAAALEKTREANALGQLTIVPFALAAEAEWRDIELPSTRGMVDSTLCSAAHRERISTISLDALWPKIGDGARIHGIKIDVQGMEVQVLRGMRAALARWAPKLVVEVHHGVNRRELVALLNGAGYASAPMAIDSRNDAGPLADDRSYFFPPGAAECGYSYTR